jgi:hypothetical protein
MHDDVILITPVLSNTKKKGDCQAWLSTILNPFTPELNPSAQRCRTRIFTGDFAS